MDPEDPTVIAENELLGAAAAIEAAAKKLEQLKPRAKPKVSPAPFFSPLLRVSAPSASPYPASLSATFVSFLQEADESLNFEEQILEAAKSIAAATSALVKAASAAQRELVAQGKVRTWIPAALPSTWHDGLLQEALRRAQVSADSCPPPQVGAIPANALDDGQWSQGLISAVSVQLPLCPSALQGLERLERGWTRAGGTF